MFTYYIENEPVLSNQSGFKLRESCIDQFKSIAREIYKSFDDCYQVRRIYQGRYI